ncbi:MAG: 30S ribosomal protein S6 [Clostridia bacterium]|nr:30S ribosomal protein S6 [Clostridia bacterium]
MENKANLYESLFVIDASLAEEDIKALVEKFTGLISANGTISEVNEWGRRRLAYPINYKTEGYYVLVNFQSEAAFPTELDRVFGITDGILRHMTLRLDEKEVKEVQAPAEIEDKPEEEE